MLIQTKFLMSRSSRYVKPQMIKTGGNNGSVADAPYGWAWSPGTTPGANNTHWYLDRELLGLIPASTPVYWEVEYAASGELYGVMRNPLTSQAYMGYSGTNWGHYSSGPTWWEDSTYSAGSWGTSSGSPVNTDILGYWFRPSDRLFRVYKNGVLWNTFTGMDGTVPQLYPGMTTQGTPGRVVPVRLGPGNTIYSPPDGAAYY